MHKPNNKTIILIRGLEEEPYLDFSSRILDWARGLAQEVKRIKVSLTTQPRPKGTIIPFSNQRIAVASLWGLEEHSPNCEIGGFAGSYQVTEAIPIEYSRDWPDLQSTPGVCLLTLFRQKPGLDRARFLDRWHNGHTPLSLRIHPLWNYNRNVVESSVKGSQQFDGIVEEQFRTTADLVNPVKFFGGNPFMVPYRMLQVYFDVNRFIDYPSIETFWAEEINVKS